MGYSRWLPVAAFGLRVVVRPCVRTGSSRTLLHDINSHRLMGVGLLRDVPGALIVSGRIAARGVITGTDCAPKARSTVRCLIQRRRQ